MLQTEHVNEPITHPPSCNLDNHSTFCTLYEPGQFIVPGAVKTTFVFTSEEQQEEATNVSLEETGMLQATSCKSSPALSLDFQRDKGKGTAGQESIQAVVFQYDWYCIGMTFTLMVRWLAMEELFIYIFLYQFIFNVTAE